MGVYLYGEATISGCPRMRELSIECYNICKTEMESGTSRAVKVMIYGESGREEFLWFMERTEEKSSHRTVSWQKNKSRKWLNFSSMETCLYVIDIYVKDKTIGINVIELHY